MKSIFLVSWLPESVFHCFSYLLMQIYKKLKKVVQKVAKKLLSDPKKSGLYALKRQLKN